MSNENKHTKPDCPLIGEDGNIFHLIGIAAKTLRRNGMSTEASEMTEKVFKSGSYQKFLGALRGVREPRIYAEQDLRD